MWRVIVSVLCCVMQAVEPSDERTPLLAGSDQMPIYSGKTWRTKIKRRLAQENHLSVFYFPKDSECYSVTYDINASLVSVRWVIKKRCERTIVPLSYALHQGILEGYVLRSGGSVPRVTDADFSENNVSLEYYHRKRYFSELLDDLLLYSIIRLEDRGKESFDHDGKALTADVLKRALPSRTYKRFFWQVVYEDDALDILAQKKKKPEVLLIVGGIGMLWGRLTNCFLRDWLWDIDGVKERSLLYYKLKGVLDQMRAKHPFSLYKFQSCLNYTGQHTVEKWRRNIRRDLAKDHHVKVFYFSKKDECYHMTHNVISTKITTYCGFADGTEGMMTVPTLYYLRQMLLEGYILKPGLPVPSVSDVDFSEKDVDLENYDREPFFSEGMSAVLVNVLPHCEVVNIGCSQRRLNRKGKVCADKTLTKGELRACITDMRAKVLPKKEANQHFCWRVVDEEDVMEIMYEIKKEPEVLLIIGGIGMLSGKLTHCFPENIPARNCRSLLHYKMESVLDVIYTKYGRPQEERQCSHDIEKNTQETAL